MFQNMVNDINGRMKRHKAYLHTVFEQIKPELDAEVAKGATLGHCYSCGFRAHVVDEVGPFESRCRVCTVYSSFLRHECKKCHTKFIVEDGFDERQPCPECDDDVTLDELLGDYSVEGQMLPEDALIDGGPGNCAECSSYHTVGTINDDQSFCFCCHQFQDPMDVCGWCNEKATGDLEMSYYAGCVMCDGKSGWDGDKD